MVAPPITYKDNLFTRLGGTNAFDFLIICHCERIQNDPTLYSLFGEMKLSDLMALQKELITVALLKPSSNISALKSRMVLRHYRLFELGLNETHFDMVVKHFSGALYDSWQSDEVVELCVRYLVELRHIFQENGMAMKEATE
eukprot:scaffold24669_cov98-Cylindrotheca_fusiformis.AAC.1